MEMLLAHAEIQPGQGHAVGRSLLAQLYRQHTGNPMPEIATTKLGKPYFIESDLHFSITHTDHHVFCALSERPIGIDAEEITRALKPALAEKLLSPEEKAQFDAAADQQKALLTFWVLKEAEAKRTGKGIGLHPRHTDFALPDARVFETDGCILAVIY
jgi:phosphopantetheinyl transferase